MRLTVRSTSARDANDGFVAIHSALAHSGARPLGGLRLDIPDGTPLPGVNVFDDRLAALADRITVVVDGDPVELLKRRPVKAKKSVVVDAELPVAGEDTTEVNDA